MAPSLERSRFGAERDGADAATHDLPVQPSWTAINRPISGQAYTSQTSASRNSTGQATTTGKRKRRSPVAQYLGLGTLRTEAQTSQLEKGSSIPSAVPALTSPSRNTTHRRLVRKTQSTGKDQKQRKVFGDNASRTAEENNRPSNTPLSSHVLHADHSTCRSSILSNTIRSSDVEICFKVQPTQRSSGYTAQSVSHYSDDDIDGIFESIDVEDFPARHYTTESQAQGQPENPNAAQFDDNAFDDGLEDDDLLLLNTEPTTDFSDATGHSRGSPYPSSHLPQQLLTTGTDASDIVDLTASDGLSGQSKLPLKRDPRVCGQDVHQNEQRRVIVRSAVPSEVRDRSPIIGLTPNTRLRTCFRIGEVINTGRNAVKNGKDVILELYARVFSSSRDNSKQSFVLCDLYHTNLPYMNAVFDAEIWRINQQFDYDSKRLLQEMKMCRCIGRMKREGKEWVLLVMSIWEASWEDIAWVEGIVNA